MMRLIDLAAWPAMMIGFVLMVRVLWGLPPAGTPLDEDIPQLLAGGALFIGGWLVLMMEDSR